MMDVNGLCDAFSTADKASWLAAIPQRYSCRSFQKDADLPLMGALEYSVARLPVKGARIVLGQCAPDDRLLFPVPFISAFSGVTRYAMVIADKSQPVSALLAGLAGEAFVLAAASMGVTTCWVAGNFIRSACDVQLQENERILAVIPFGLAEDSTFARKRKPLKQLCKGDPAPWPLWAYQAAEAVRGAPSAMNRQPWRFDFTGSTLRVDFSSFNSLDTGIALLHLFCALHGENCAYSLSSKGSTLLIFRKEEP